MTRRRYTKIIIGTFAVLIALAALAWLATLGAASECRGEGCGWVPLIALFWVILYWPALAVMLLAGYAVCSAKRARDAGLPAVLGLLPALILPGIILTLRGMAEAPDHWFTRPQTALQLLPLVVFILVAACLFILRSDASHHTSATAIGRALSIASVIALVANIPAFLLSTAMMSWRFLTATGMRGLLDPLYDVGLASSWVAYTRLIALAIVMLALLGLLWMKNPLRQLDIA